MTLSWENSQKLKTAANHRKPNNYYETGASSVKKAKTHSTTNRL